MEILMLLMENGEEKQNESTILIYYILGLLVHVRGKGFCKISVS